MPDQEHKRAEPPARGRPPIVVTGYSGTVSIGALDQLHALAALHVTDATGDEAMALLELRQLDEAIAALRVMRDYLANAREVGR
jgi:hypothetical protein